MPIGFANTGPGDETNVVVGKNNDDDDDDDDDDTAESVAERVSGSK